MIHALLANFWIAMSSLANRGSGACNAAARWFNTRAQRAVDRWSYAIGDRPTSDPPEARYVFLCANGMVCVFGADDQQITRAQGRWLRDSVRLWVMRRGVHCPEDVKIAMQATEDVLR